MIKPIKVPKSICLLVGALGVAAYGATAAIDIMYGHSMTVSKGGEVLQPLAMAIVSGAAFAFVCVAGAFARGRHFAAAAGAFVLACGFLSYTALNGVGFFAAESLGKTRLADTQNKQSKAITDLQNAQALEARKGFMTWLQSTYTAKAPVAEKERITEKMLELSNQPVVLKKPDVQEVVGDARSEIMSQFMGSNIESAQIGNAVWLTVLLIAVKLFGPSLMIGLWPRPDFDGGHQNETHQNHSVISQIAPAPIKTKNKDEALVDLRGLFPRRTEIITVTFLHIRWGISKQAVHYRLKDWQRRGQISIRDEGGQIYVSAIKDAPSNVVPITTAARA